MPAPRILLDTNALIPWLASDAGLREFGIGAEWSPAVTMFTVAEMHYGIQRSSRPSDNERSLNRALRDLDVILPDLETARYFGLVHARLRRMGRPIPVNDMWIAALALQHDLPVLTRDSHFTLVEDLQVVGW